MCWFHIVRSTMMPAAIYQQMDSYWLFLYPAASEAFQMRASLLSILLHLTTWGKCSIPNVSVSVVPKSARLKVLFWSLAMLIGLLCYTQVPMPSLWACLQWDAMWWLVWPHAESCSIPPLTTWWRKCSVCSSHMEEKLPSGWMIRSTLTLGQLYVCILCMLCILTLVSLLYVDGV